MRPFILSDEEILEYDTSERVFYDKFMAVGQGCSYKGQWLKGTQIRDGLGIQLMADGSKYEGTWKNNIYHGKGRMTHANGDIYQG